MFLEDGGFQMLTTAVSAILVSQYKYYNSVTTLHLQKQTTIMTYIMIHLESLLNPRLISSKDIFRNSLITINMYNKMKKRTQNFTQYKDALIIYHLL